MNSENSFKLFLRRYFKIFLLSFFLFGIFGVLYSSFLPEIFKAESKIAPSSASSHSSAAAILSQAGGVASLMGLNISTKGEFLMGILRSQTLIDKIIDKFNLMEVYEQAYRSQMRNFVTEQILHLTEDVKSGIITVAVLDKDPVRAAAIANTFVEELKESLSSFVIGEAAQRRQFFQDQMLTMYDVLTEAENELQRYQEESGLVAMEPQVIAIINSIASLRAEIAAKEVEISTLLTYAKNNNPNLIRALSQLDSLKNELRKLEMREREQETRNKDYAKSNSLSSTPLLGIEYQRRLRDVKYANAMYEMMLKQFEAAKIDESREAFYIQVLDKAIVPDYKFKPKRSLIVLYVVLFGSSFVILLAFLIDFLGQKDSSSLNPKNMN